MKRNSLAVLCFAAVQLLTSSADAQSINLYEDSVHTPFVYGVASGDPTDTSVLIWTATIAAPSFHSELINWELSTDSLFSVQIVSGTEMVDSSHGYTINTEATGLQAGMKYYYRFEWQGNYSVTGITYTAFADEPDSLNLGLVSCSSLFSGYFNGYRQLAHMPGMKGLIHVGDFIYDFADDNELIRIPADFTEPDDTITENWRAIHRLYLTDPDLREARRMFPWICTWDNHDVVRSNPAHSSQAYREFVPFRGDASDSLRIWRKVSYGPLLDIFMIDINIQGGIDTFPSGTLKAMSDEQFDWLKAGLAASTAKWKFIGSEKLFAQWDLTGFPLPGSGLSKTWNGYPESRDSLLTHLRDNNIDNTVILSGDFHMNIWSDITTDPFNPLVYDSATGNGSIAIEMMGISLSRGNLDESGVPYSLAPNFHQASLNANPHQQYINLFDNGFNTISLFSDSLVARSYLCPILELSDAIVLDAKRVCMADDNHWQRVLSTSVEEIGVSGSFMVYPNPASDFITFTTPDNNVAVTVTIYSATGQLVHSEIVSNNQQQIKVSNLRSGMYMMEARSDKGTEVQKLIIQR